MDYERVEVSVHGGYKADEYPKSFIMGVKKLAVLKILDRWYEPEHSYFKVRAEDNNCYIIRLNTCLQYWELHRIMK